MTDLRKRMVEDMQLHGYAERTMQSYADVVGGLAGDIKQLSVARKPMMNARRCK